MNVLGSAAFKPNIVISFNKRIISVRYFDHTRTLVMSLSNSFRNAQKIVAFFRRTHAVGDNEGKRAKVSKARKVMRREIFALYVHPL